MSNDLISRSKLISVFQKDKEQLQKGLGKDAMYAYMTADYVVNKINNAPTAYDVDKVVARLENAKQDIALIYLTDQGYDYDEANGIEINKAIEIVKEGGVNEDV